MKKGVAMRFVKSIQSNESTQVYFDEFDNKYIRKGGSLAWRCNNPGLVHSHSNIARRHGPIGHCGQYPVFPNASIGREALISWLHLNSYYTKPIIAIAQFQSSDKPSEYLSKLCSLSDLSSKAIPSKLSRAQFDKLAWAIEELAGARIVFGNENFEQIPKILGEFSSRCGTAHYYLIADKRILSKEEALAEVKIRKIDAIVVNRSDGMEYLRSRPGHILSQIYISEKKAIKVFRFENLIRESGKERKGQVIWGFINGIFNSSQRAQYNLSKMVQAVNGERVWGMVNNTGLMQGGGISDALFMELGYSPEAVNVAVEYLNLLALQAEKEPHRPLIIVVAHSEGAMLAELATKQMEPSVRNKILFWTLGGAGFVPATICHAGTCNFINQHDLVVRATSPFDYRILMVRDQFRNKNAGDIVRYLAEEDLIVQGLDTGPAYESFKKEKMAKYKKRLEELSNTKIIYHKKTKGLHHEFNNPHYQAKLRELVNGFYGYK
ncbi:hypothetical protein JYU14_04065 [Simkania negevensis]|uniref:Uncharacterized protein n=1 Tax=Simkania negevensis TaxID=83561 RepID=A0ABS3AR78_9BACT|nr:hypothetical protein [Simkania negevensis]